MSRLWPVLLSLLMAGPLLAAEGDTPPPRMTTDRQIIDLLARVHDQGAALFNAADYGGCYRMFQGALVTAKLVLPKELQESVDRGLSRAEMQTDPVRRAINRSRMPASIKAACCSAVFTGTNCMVGRPVASHTPSASRPSFLLRLI